MEKIIMHIDVNNAFLSWTAVELLEQGHKQDIRTIDAIIGGDESRRAGIVLAKSPPAKAKGVVTAETIYSAKRKCPNLKVFPPNFTNYKKRSNELFKLLLKYTPDIEIASIDECYLDYGKVKKLYGDELDFAKKLQKEINKKLGFTINIGIANNKLCAKMASDFSKPNKIHTLYNEEIKTKMFPLPIEDLFGVGKQTSKKLREIGIKTIKDLAETQEINLKRIFKHQAKHLIELANGIDESEVDPSSHVPKGLSNEITLKEDITEKTKLYKKLEILSEILSKRIRKEEKHAFVICVILKDNTFKRYSHQKKLKNGISSYNEILKYSKQVLDEFYNEEQVRLIGIRLDNLKKTKTYQTSLFEQEPKKDEKLEKLIDEINDKYGKNTIKRASNIDNKQF